LLAAAIVGNQHREIREALRKFRKEQTAKVLATPDPATAATMSAVIGGAPKASPENVKMETKRKKRG